MRSRDHLQATRAGSLAGSTRIARQARAAGIRILTARAFVLFIQMFLLMSLQLYLRLHDWAEQDGSARRQPALRRSDVQNPAQRGAPSQTRGRTWDPQRQPGRPHRYRHATASSRTQTHSAAPRPEAGATQSLRCHPSPPPSRPRTSTRHRHATRSRPGRRRDVCGPSTTKTGERSGPPTTMAQLRGRGPVLHGLRLRRSNRQPTAIPKVNAHDACDMIDNLYEHHPPLHRTIFPHAPALGPRPTST